VSDIGRLRAENGHFSNHCITMSGNIGKAG